MLKCKEITELIGSEGLEEQPIRRRLSVRLHLLMCRHCRSYAGQLRSIGEAARGLFGRESESSDPTVEERLKRTILKDPE